MTPLNLISQLSLGRERAITIKNNAKLRLYFELCKYINIV